MFTNERVFTEESTWNKESLNLDITEKRKKQINGYFYCLQTEWDIAMRLSLRAMWGGTKDCIDFADCNPLVRLTCTEIQNRIPSGLFLKFFRNSLESGILLWSPYL